MEIDEHTKLPNSIHDHSASNDSNRCDILSAAESPCFGQANNDVVCLLSDDEDMNSYVRVDTAEPMVLFTNDEVTLELRKPSLTEFGSYDNESGSAENLRKQSVERTRNLQQPITQHEEDNISNHTATLPNTESVACNNVKSIASNEFQNGDSTDNVVETTGKTQGCINSDCTSNRTIVAFCEAPMWALNYFNVPRKFGRQQFVCQNCFDAAINDYERLCVTLINQQPLLLEQLPVRPEVVEIVDSDEEDSAGSSNIECTKPLPPETLALLEQHLDNVVKEAMNRLNIEQQTIWTNQILEHKLETNAAMSASIDEEINSLQKRSESMYRNIYKRSKCAIEELPPFDLNENKEMHMYGPDYPPRGEVVYPPIDQNSLYYAVRTKLTSTWMPCTVTEQVDGAADGRTMFKVTFLRCYDDRNTSVSGNHLAYGTAPSVRLSVGTRVIAFPTLKSTTNSGLILLPGIIAEPLQEYNRWRYLIFFDDGCVRYVSPDNIRLICSPSPNVWEDVHHDTAAFIKSYLEQYKIERPMVQVKRNQKMITEWNSVWRNAHVEDVDASLVLMYFDSTKGREWIYRGSMRLGPLFRDHQLQQRSALLAKGIEPFEELITIDDDDESENCGETTPESVRPEESPVTNPISIEPFVKQITIDDDGEIENCRETVLKYAQPVEPPVTNPISIPSTSQAVQPFVQGKRSVAKKKSVTMASRPTVQCMNKATIYIYEDGRPEGKIVNYSVKKHIPPRKYAYHICGAACLREVKHDLSSYSPLAKPLLSGWERRILRAKTKKSVMYRTPCGRSLRNMHELHIYLRATKCTWNVDNFDFGILTSCLAEYVVERPFIKKKDLSDGCEAMVVSCVNCYDDTMPLPCVYSAERLPTEGVPLNLDANFLCGCDCDDDCWDKTKCQCWQLTLEGARLVSPDTPIERMGYEFKRLPDAIPTGIYECNSQCKCSKACLNRVAQHPLQLKMQVFKTISRGWGLRCLNDVPNGTFVCVYAGDLLTDKNANIAGRLYGDEYFAELDYIEVIENRKEGYEPEVMDDGFIATSETARRIAFDPCNSTDASNKKNDTESLELKVEPAFISDEDDIQRLSSSDPNSSSFSVARSNSILRFYDKNESLFTMDAMKRGNIGRYINHSCEPNLFVQNVFVDTHDLRFPWVAFFSKCYIPAGSELSWDYSYVVGSVPGKVLFCECGAKHCRGRIL